jgi:hypothetical protein
MGYRMAREVIRDSISPAPTASKRWPHIFYEGARGWGSFVTTDGAPRAIAKRAQPRLVG